MAETRNGRIKIALKDGIAIIASDAHYWPGKPTTAHRALVQFMHSEPSVVVMNGDVIDASTISRHPPIGWEDHPTVAEEIEVAQERLAEIEEAYPKARRIWTLGNHDARYETRLAALVPEYKHIRGVHLKDHFPSWEPAWDVEIGGPQGAMVKHRWKGGHHAAFNNALHSGRTIITGHLHRLGVRAFTDYTGTRYGVEGGMLADPGGPQFRGYTENNPVDWRSGFVVLTFKAGRLLWPEIVYVARKGVIEWRGEEYKI